MNNLNSVLLEGKLKGDPTFDKKSEDGPAACAFTVVSYRHNKRLLLKVVAKARLGEVCAEYLKKGRGVRVVGSLMTDVEQRAWIEAEHIEFRPNLKKEKADE